VPARPLRAIQQIQIGSIASSEARARDVLERLVAYGYEGIELNGFMTRPSSLLVRALTRAAGMPVGRAGRLDWAALVPAVGLRVVALHEDLGTIERDPDEVARQADRFGTDTIVITGMYRFDYGDEAAVGDLVARLNAAGRTLRERGLRLLYHNHSVEFRRAHSGRTAMDTIIDGTDPEFVGFELDCFWAASAGADPLALMRRLGSRLELCHLTDRGSTRTGSSLTPIDRIDSVELGAGNLDIDGLVAQSATAGARAVVVETHRNWIDGSPLRSAEVSAEALNRLLV